MSSPTVPIPPTITVNADRVATITVPVHTAYDLLGHAAGSAQERGDEPTYDVANALLDELDSRAEACAGGLDADGYCPVCYPRPQAGA